MKRIFSFFSLLGIVSLSCSSLSPNPKPTEKETVGNGPTTIMQDGVPVQEFSLDNTDAIPPEDVFIDVMHFNSGGGFDGVICINPETGDPYTYLEPTIIQDPDDTELMLASELVMCGWKENQELNGKIEYPDGRIKEKTFLANEIGAGVFSFVPSLDDPIGLYDIEVSDPDFALETNIYYYTPVVPRIYYISENQLLLNNFSVGDVVTLFVHGDEDGIIVGQGKIPIGGKSFIIENSNGLIVNTSSVNGNVFVGTDSFGLVYDVVATNGFRVLDNFDVGYIDLREKDDSYALRLDEYKAKMKSYLDCGESIKTTFNGNFPQYYEMNSSEIDVYIKPRLSSRKIDQLTMGEKFAVSDSYYCFDDLIWRSVSLPNIEIVYIVESAINSNIDIKQESCGKLPTRLSWNTSTQVSYSNGNNKNVRKEPGFSSEVLITLPEGSQITAWRSWCADDAYWYFVTTPFGDNLGWMTETQSGVYFLEPAPK